MDKGEMKAGAARVAINLEDVLPFDGFDALRHEIFARAFVVEGMGRRVCILSLEVTSIDRGGVSQQRQGPDGNC